MKKIFLFIFLYVFSVTISFAAIEDDSIIKELETDNFKELNIDFNLKSFESCENLETVMEKYIKNYWENNKSRYRGWPIMYKTFWWEVDMIMEDSIESESSAPLTKSVSNEVWWWVSDDFSETNVQVKWVDESDIVKTDWKYIYYFNDSDKYVYIVKVWTLEIIKKIQIPKNFNSPVLYISDNRLTIISSGYSNTDYSKRGYWINRNSKTYTIIFDTTDINNPILAKLYIADWNLRKSRMIGDYLYIISNNNFSIPYYNFNALEDIKVDSNSLIPKTIELSKTTDENKQNLELKWKKLPYNLKAWNVASCNEIEYVLPDEDTLSEYDFSPSYNIISVINVSDYDEDIEKKVVAWNNAEIYMSLDNLYLTSNIYTSYNYKCPVWARCIMPWYPRGQNTLVHQINVDWNDLKYSASTIVPWRPLTQYSMDQYQDKFRIITQTNHPELATNLYILNSDDLKLDWSLTSIEPGEQFKSSRFIWDKLFLVTFERIDPLFVIDLKDFKNPKIIWELKIPWYSTYLHPYDENHLIWLGYNTKENQWWWTVNNWIKLDLYEINYDKKTWVSSDCNNYSFIGWENEEFECPNYCNIKIEKDDCIKTGFCEGWSTSYNCSAKEDNAKKDYIEVKQKYTKTFWENWSYSEALNNPRMFMWKASDNKLFLPVQLYKNAEDDQYRRTDFFQWLITLTIDKDTWIEEDFRLSHIDDSKIEEQRQEECSKYTKDTTEKKCVELIWGWEYCESVKYKYVPKYCYADSPVWEYLASRSRQYRNSFIKRALWIWDNTYAISNDQISSSDIDSWDRVNSVELK